MEMQPPPAETPSDGLRRPPTPPSLRAALEEADGPALLMALVQLTGDRSWLDRLDHRRRNPLGATPPTLSPAARAEVLDAAEQALLQWLQDGTAAIPVPDEDLCGQMLTACAGENVASEYVPMVLEEMGYSSRWVQWRRRPPRKQLDSFHTVIIGAGASGLCVAMQLQQLGIAFTVVEKNESVGGTWYENSYPGCRVDVPNHFYSYSFEPNPDWSDYYSRQPELHAYFERCALNHDIGKKIRFGREVERATYDSGSKQWSLTLRTRTGELETLHANVVISAVGQLNRPKMPALPGLEDFEGPVFHSSAWRHDVDLTGRQVAVVGTGASAMQFVPSIAERVDRLTVFQRSPQWALPNPNYRRAVSEGQRWLLHNVPFYGGWYRFSLLWSLADGLWPLLKVDPNWPDHSRSINSANESVRLWLTRYVADQLEHRQDLIDKALPNYAPFSKRILADNGWYTTLLRKNVELHTAPIKRVHRNSVETATGEQRPVDVIICGTGFESTRMLWPMRVEGQDRILSEVWDDDDPRAYLGLTVPDFPNLFLMYGPSTNLGHGGSIVFHAECQARYIATCVRELLERDCQTMAISQDAHEEYNQRLDEAMADLIWAQAEVGSWYTNSKRRVVTNSPWRLVDYWSMTADPKFEDWLFDDQKHAAGRDERSDAVIGRVSEFKEGAA